MIARLLLCLAGLALLLSTGASPRANVAPNPGDSYRRRLVSLNVSPDIPPVRVLVSKDAATPGRILYRYTVVNGSTSPITSLLVGYDYFYGTPELMVAPIGWEGSAVADSNAQSPRGWKFAVVTTEEDSLLNVEWEIDSPSDTIPGGATLGGFEVTLPEEDFAYEEGHWTVYLAEGKLHFSGSLHPVAASRGPHRDALPDSGAGRGQK